MLRFMAMNGAAAVSGLELGLDQSWVVEASAGTGKTTALVARNVEVIAAGTPVETIVAQLLSRMPPRGAI